MQFLLQRFPCDVARLLGAYLGDVYHTFDEPMALGNLPVQGTFGEWVVTTATVQATFADGRPAILEHRLGDGRTICFAFEVCGRCAAPGQEAFEQLLTEAVMADRHRPWRCPGALAFRRQVREIDYYYLINLGDTLETSLQVFDTSYGRVWDVIEETDLPIHANTEGKGNAIPVLLPQGMGCWLRCERG